MNIFRRLILWAAYQLIWLALPQVLIDGAILNTLKINPVPHTSDEKRQLVYVKLLKQYPNLPRRLLSLAVELAIYKRL